MQKGVEYCYGHLVSLNPDSRDAKKEHHRLFENNVGLARVRTKYVDRRPKYRYWCGTKRGWTEKIVRPRLFYPICETAKCSQAADLDHSIDGLSWGQAAPWAIRYTWADPGDPRDHGRVCKSMYGHQRLHTRSVLTPGHSKSQQT